MVYAIYIVLVLVSFLLVLNGFGKGALKPQIHAVFSLLLIGLVITTFFIAGWKLGFLAIGIAFISAIVTRPIAARLASRLFAIINGSSGGQYVGLPPRRLRKISRQLGKPMKPVPNKLIIIIGLGRWAKRWASTEDALLDYCEQQPATQALLREFKISRHDLQELFHQLIDAGAGQWRCGHWVAASALAYPDSLLYMLKRREENMEETAFNLLMYFEQGSPLGT